jgi:hypothetical protein
MVGTLRRRVVGAVAAAVLIVPLSTSPSGAAGRAPRILHVAQIARQDIAPKPGSEPDTLVEPSVAVDPLQPHTAVAAAHDGRYPDGGAVDISYSWTRDGGANWQHAPVPFLTTAVGGTYDRASDPVVQFGPDGTAYLSTLLFDVPACPTAVAVSKSVDGGATWGRPVLVHSSTSCNYSDDKNWLVIDSSPFSPHFGRLYQFWTPFISSDGVNFTSPQVVRFSDDKGTTWSQTFMVNPLNANTQDSQPMVLANGSVVDTYANYGPSRVMGDSPIHHPSGPRRFDQANAPIDLDARRSNDGGMTWGPEVVISHNLGQGFTDVRCCLEGGTIDAVTGRMYVAFEAAGPGDEDPVMLSSSTDGLTWTTPLTVSQGDAPGIQEINVAVSALGGEVFVSYGTRTDPANNGGFVQQKLATSFDSGATFASTMNLGPVSALQWAAQAGGLFPGDYVGAAVSGQWLYLVWCVSSQPPTPAAFHQTLWSATLRI